MLSFLCIGLYNAAMSTLERWEYTQLSMPFFESLHPISVEPDASCAEKLSVLLQGDLDFQGKNGIYASHHFHAFPAKFPPQLPSLFIEHLTRPGDVVLDPMAGSGTTLVEAVLAGRKGIGFDIDPLALLVAHVKTTPLDPFLAAKIGYSIVKEATHLRTENADDLWRIKNRWTRKTSEFVDYWFMEESQLELLALSAAIHGFSNGDFQSFFRLIFSSIIITKSGGVSLARDLAHTRPHRAKIIFSPSGEILEGERLLEEANPRINHISKKLKSPIHEFEKKLDKAIEGLRQMKNAQKSDAFLLHGDAQALPLQANSVDLIITSPPYASNAIDYMRAHKFSLVWFGHSIESLGQTRKKYIGGEATDDSCFEQLAEVPRRIVKAVGMEDKRKGRVLHRYYSEMKRMLQEMQRVLRPGRAAVIIVGSSLMRGKDTETGQCLAAIGQSVGLKLIHIGRREIDRNKRMMPAGHKVDPESQIQRRMHQEFVIGFIK